MLFRSVRHLALLALRRVDECRCRRGASKAKCRTRRVRRKVSDDQRVEAGHRYLRERSGVADGATAAGRTHGRAGKNPGRGTQDDRIHDAGTSKTLNGATGASDMAGKAARVAIERRGSCRDTKRILLRPATVGLQRDLPSSHYGMASRNA